MWCDESGSRYEEELTRHGELYVKSQDIPEYSDDGKRSRVKARDGGEVVNRIVLDAFGVVDKRRENNDTENKEENEKRELVSAGFERVDENLESGRVSRQLKQSHDADNAEELEDVMVLFHVGQHVVQIER